MKSLIALVTATSDLSHSELERDREWEGGQGSTEIRPKKDRRSEERGEELNEVPLELRAETLKWTNDRDRTPNDASDAKEMHAVLTEYTLASCGSPNLLLMLE